MFIGTIFLPRRSHSRERGNPVLNDVGLLYQKYQNKGQHVPLGDIFCSGNRIRLFADLSFQTWSKPSNIDILKSDQWSLLVASIHLYYFIFTE